MIWCRNLSCEYRQRSFNREDFMAVLVEGISVVIKAEAITGKLMGDIRS